MRTSPVVGPGGAIYVVAYDGHSDGLWAINPNGTKRWSTSLPWATSSPAIGRDGSVYVANGQTLFAYTPDGATTAWTFSIGGTGGFYSSCPAIGADGTIYLGALNSRFYAVYNTNLLAGSAWCHLKMMSRTRVDNAHQ